VFGGKMNIEIPKENCCKDNERCQFFSSGYVDDDAYYSNNPSCCLYNKTIKEVSKNGGCDNFNHDLSEWYNVTKPSFCNAKNVIIVETA